LVEVQGYVYRAKQQIAELFERSGETARADKLRREADELRRRFNRDFWLEDQGYYALALQGADKRPSAVLSSNPGHALWSGIADPDKAQRLAERLLSEEMYSGWGIRTLATHELRYNPISYHRGSVWPHDNALIAAGFRRYGLDDPARRVLKGILDAAMDFEAYRMPELFTGFTRAEYGIPVLYPVACHPQAWAAGAVLHLIQTALGLVPEAFERRLRIVRPMLPEFVDRLRVERLRVGGATADLCFERGANGTVSAQVCQIDGPLDVVVEPAR
jgi:glycogen debranching enzyme